MRLLLIYQLLLAKHSKGIREVVINSDNGGFPSYINIEGVNAIIRVGPYFRDEDFLNSFIFGSNG
jgi:hypothetical protein